MYWRSGRIVIALMSGGWFLHTGHQLYHYENIERITLEGDSLE